jgi:phospholipase C
MPPGLDALKHIVVLMMENRSFDHMLGSLKAVNSEIDGLDGTQSNPDTQGNQVFVQPLAEYQSQLDPDPDHHFPAVDLQLFNGDQNRDDVPSMQGFVKSYFQQQKDVNHSHKIMYYFPRNKLPVLTSLALNYALFDRWFASIPGPTICNRAFAHYGTSFGRADMTMFYPMGKSIYERLENGGRTAKLYYFDQASSTMEIVNLLQHQPQLFGTFDQFLQDCKTGKLPDYSFVEPNYTDHDGDDGAMIASDQHPDHNVQEGERYIAQVYNAIRSNPTLWESTALLVVYDEHGGIYDHVPPPKVTPDGNSAGPTGTGLDYTFTFNRLGVRVPAILISPWVQKGLVVPRDRTFEHASIPATATQYFLPNYDQNTASLPAGQQRTAREKAAPTFLDLLSLPAMRTDSLFFNV